MRFWAWLRYFAAIGPSADLRISHPFVELDPHQRGILSDDLGVALTVNWLYSKLNFTEIVDGRRFLLNYTSLIRRPRAKPPKNGVGKTPDYVVRDGAGRWHVLECKGTQTSKAYRDEQLKTAVQQKAAIRVKGRLRGESLAAGVYLASEHSKSSSHLRVVDPVASDAVLIEPESESAALSALNRVSVARALALSGFEELALEVAMPPTEVVETDLLTSGEARRLSVDPETRWRDANASDQEEGHTKFARGPNRYIGRKVSVDVPIAAFRRNTGCSRIRVTQGIDSDFVEALRSIGTHAQEEITRLSRIIGDAGGIHIESEGNKVVITDGTLYRAELELLP